MRYLVGFPIFAIVIMFIINVILALLLVLTYSGLTKENIVATIKFDSIPNQNNVYVAHIFDKDSKKIGDYTIYSDQWRIDAGFIKMEYWANIIGIESKYTLNRFEGRYSDIIKENTKQHKAYQLEEHSLIDNFSFFFDTTYGSSVYKEIKLKTLFTVLHSPTGLLVREKVIKEPKKEKSFMEKTKSFLGISTDN